MRRLPQGKRQIIYTINTKKSGCFPIGISTAFCAEPAHPISAPARVRAEAKRRLPHENVKSSLAPMFSRLFHQIADTESLHLRGRGTTKWWKEFLHPHHTDKLPFGCFKPIVGILIYRRRACAGVYRGTRLGFHSLSHEGIICFNYCGGESPLTYIGGLCWFFFARHTKA